MIGVPSGRSSREVPSISVPATECSAAGSHRFGRPATHMRHAPHGGTKQNATAVAGGDVRDARADRLDDAGALVPEHDRPAAVAQVALGEVQVGVAHARSRHAHEHLVVLGRVQQQPLDAHRQAVALEHGRLDLDRGAAHATLWRSSASRSGSTPSPGPAGGRIVPSAAIRTGAGSSQSRRSAVHAGGSNGTSTYGHVENASAACRLQTRP